MKVHNTQPDHTDLQIDKNQHKSVSNEQPEHARPNEIAIPFSRHVWDYLADLLAQSFQDKPLVNPLRSGRSLGQQNT
jgi:hypothetical protein